MQFSAPITALLGMFFLASSAVATPMSGELDVRQAPNGYCNAQNPIAKYPEGGSCSGNGYACSLNCVDIVSTLRTIAPSRLEEGE